MATQLQVIELHKQNPTLTAKQIADRLGCMPEYVRATGRRCGLKFPGRQTAREELSQLIALGMAAREAGLTVDRIFELHRAGALRP